MTGFTRGGASGLPRRAVVPVSRWNGFRRRRREAFTLIELLVVIAVVAILAAILLRVLSKRELRAQGLQCESNTKQLLTAAIMYELDYGTVTCCGAAIVWFPVI